MHWILEIYNLNHLSFSFFYSQNNLFYYDFFLSPAFPALRSNVDVFAFRTD